MSGAMMPAPAKGWITRLPLAEMPMDAASELENLIPRGDGVKTRPGYAAHSSDLSAAVETLVTYHGATEKIICASGGKIIDITAGGTGTNLGTGFTEDQWNTTEFSNRIIFTNGTDGVRDYDGSTLATTSISGATSADLIHCTSHKGRVFYIEKDSQSFWYPSAGAYAGAMTEFDLSQFTTTGGDLLYMVSWTRDGGSGVDDLACFVFDGGEVLVYAGSDPGSSTDWSLLGRFRIGAPLGRRSQIQIGGDVLIATVDGVVPLSAALQEGLWTEQSSFSYLIDPTVKDSAQVYESNFGWGMAHWPQASLFLLNVPISSTQSEQYARNTATGAWTRFTGMDASCWSVYNSNLYFGSPDGYVYKVAGTSDAGAFIPYRAVQAFNDFGARHRRKSITAVQPITDFSFPKYLDCQFHSDYIVRTLGDYSAPPENTVSEWNVGDWNVADWITDSRDPQVARKNAEGLGYALALEMRWKSRAQAVTWHGTDLWLKAAGIV